MTDTLPTHMKVITLNGFGGPEVLVEASEPVPQPGPGEVLIKVVAAAVNRPDVLQRLGLYPSPKGVPDRPGLDIAGEVVALGAGVGDLAIGDPVCALVAGGGYATYCLAPAPQILPVPGNFSFVEAAALPETFFTVWTNLFERGRLKSGETALIHGGASGIGTTAVMLASALGSRVIATCSKDKCLAIEQLGAARAIDYRDEDFVGIVKEMTDGQGCDVILDMVGGDYTPRNIDALALDGRLVQIAFLRGGKVELDLNAVMRKRLTVTGSTLRTRPVTEKGAIASALRERVWPLLAARRIAPVIDRTYPLSQAAEAHRHLDSGTHIGKVVLTCD